MTIEQEAIERWGGIKRREGDDIFFLCPACQHDSLSVSVRRGCFHCLRCGYGRKQRRLQGDTTAPERDPVDPDALAEVGAAILDVSKLDPLHERYLRQRGIYRPDYWGIVSVPAQIHRRVLPYFTPERMIASGLFVRDVDEIVVPSGVLEWRRILVPYWHGDRIVGIKTRENPYAFEAVDSDRRWSTSRGSRVGSHLFYRGRLGEDCIMTEGELKIAAACDVGFSGAASPGMNASAPVLTQLADLMKKSGTKRLFIINDTESDTWSNYALLQATLRMAQVFKTRTAIGFLPQDKRTEKMDLDLFLVRKGERELDALLEDFWKVRDATFNRISSRVRDLKPRGF